jgi:2-haloacid dehalogenase
MRPRALLFDVFGTLVDWRGSLIAAGERTGVEVDWPAVVDDWRRAYLPALERVRTGRTWRDFDSIHHETLSDVLQRHHLDLPPETRDRLVRGWRELRPWPDVQPGLLALRERYVTATLSNGHVALLVDLLRYGDLRVDAVLSAELAESYKPDPRVYLHGAELLRLPAAEVGMVAAHAWDLREPAALGMRPVFVRRPDEWGGAPVNEPPTELAGLVVVGSLAELAELGELG